MLIHRSLLLTLLIIALTASAAHAATRNPVGSLDRSFGGDGRVRVPLQFDAQNVIDARAAKGGKIRLLVRVENVGGSGTTALVQVDRRGRLDRSFSEDGIALNPVGTDGSEVVTELAIDKQDRSYVLGGVAAKPGDEVRASQVARYLPSGDRDQTFGTAGVAPVRISPPDDGSANDPASLIVDPADGTVTVGVNILRSWIQGAVVKLTASGASDTSFAANGTFYLGTDGLGGANGLINKLVRASDGKAWILGAQPYAYAEGGLRRGCTVTRISAGGDVDRTFAHGRAEWQNLGGGGYLSSSGCNDIWDRRGGGFTIQVPTWYPSPKPQLPETRLVRTDPSGVADPLAPGGPNQLLPQVVLPSWASWGSSLNLSQTARGGFVSAQSDSSTVLLRYHADGRPFSRKGKFGVLRISPNGIYTDAKPIRLSASTYVVAGVLANSRFSSDLELIRIKLK